MTVRERQIAYVKGYQSKAEALEPLAVGARLDADS